MLAERRKLRQTPIKNHQQITGDMASKFLVESDFSELTQTKVIILAAVDIVLRNNYEFESKLVSPTAKK